MSSSFPAPGRGDRRGVVALVVGALAVVASVTLAVTVGPADLAPVEVWRSIAAHLGHLVGAVEDPTAGLGALRDSIVWELRLPRVLTAAAVGAGLAVAGSYLDGIGVPACVAAAGRAVDEVLSHDGRMAR